MALHLIRPGQSRLVENETACSLPINCALSIISGPKSGVVKRWSQRPPPVGLADTIFNGFLRRFGGIRIVTVQPVLQMSSFLEYALNRFTSCQPPSMFELHDANG